MTRPLRMGMCEVERDSNGPDRQDLFEGEMIRFRPAPKVSSTAALACPPAAAQACGVPNYGTVTLRSGLPDHVTSAVGRQCRHRQLRSAASPAPDVRWSIRAARCHDHFRRRAGRYTRVVPAKRLLVLRDDGGGRGQSLSLQQSVEPDVMRWSAPMAMRACSRRSSAFSASRWLEVQTWSDPGQLRD